MTSKDSSMQECKIWAGLKRRMNNGSSKWRITK
jgi:hypothetical protein